MFSTARQAKLEKPKSAMCVCLNTVGLMTHDCVTAKLLESFFLHVLSDCNIAHMLIVKLPDDADLSHLLWCHTESECVSKCGQQHCGFYSKHMQMSMQEKIIDSPHSYTQK